MLIQKNANPGCKLAIRHLKARVPVDEWIRYTVYIGSHVYDTWIGEVISKNFKKNQKVRYFNYGKPCHLERLGISKNNIFSRKKPNRRLQPSGICRRCGKG